MVDDFVERYLNLPRIACVPELARDPALIRAVISRWRYLPSAMWTNILHNLEDEIELAISDHGLDPIWLDYVRHYLEAVDD